MEVTLCLIVKNEGKNLAKCLKSFKPVYDKLIVVDTGSKDNTKKIAAEFGAAVFDYKWRDDFASARNFALSKAKTEWLMMVDADDEMAVHDAKNLKKKIENLGEKVNGIMLPYILPHFGKNRDVKAYITRIWRRNLKAGYVSPVHEYLKPTPEQIKSFIRLDFPIIHTKNDDLFKKSFERNIRLLKKAIKKDPAERRHYFFLGHDNQQIGNLNEAILWYQKYIDLPNPNKDELNRVLNYKAGCHRGIGELQEAEILYKKAISVNPDFIEPYLHLAEIHKQKKQYGEAVEYYIKAAACRMPRTHIFIDSSLYKDYPENKLMELLEIIKKEHDAA